MTTLPVRCSAVSLAAQQIAERMFEQKTKLADEAHAFRAEFNALVNDTLQAPLSTSTE